MNLQPPRLIAPPIQASAWLNVPQPLPLADLSGRVVLLHAFQMLCPGCVSHSLPQALSVRRQFAEADLAVIGLHSVFEHHAIMTIDALRVFAHEYRLTFPLAVDLPGRGQPIPATMLAYEMQGTPTHILIDARGYLRAQHFGAVSDLALGAAIGVLLTEGDGKSECLTMPDELAAATRCLANS